MAIEWCKVCGGIGYIETPDYDWDENPIEPMRAPCYKCDSTGYTARPVEYEPIIYVVTSYYNDGDLERAYEVEEPISAYHSLQKAMRFCGDEGGYEVEVNESLEPIKAYKIDECEYYKIYEVSIK